MTEGQLRHTVLALFQSAGRAPPALMYPIQQKTWRRTGRVGVCITRKLVMEASFPHALVLQDKTGAIEKILLVTSFLGAYRIASQPLYELGPECYEQVWPTRVQIKELDDTQEAPPLPVFRMTWDGFVPAPPDELPQAFVQEYAQMLADAAFLQAEAINVDHVRGVVRRRWREALPSIANIQAARDAVLMSHAATLVNESDTAVEQWSELEYLAASLWADPAEAYDGGNEVDMDTELAALARMPTHLRDERKANVMTVKHRWVFPYAHALKLLLLVKTRPVELLGWQKHAERVSEVVDAAWHVELKRLAQEARTADERRFANGFQLMKGGGSTTGANLVAHLPPCMQRVREHGHTGDCHLADYDRGQWSAFCVGLGLIDIEEIVALAEDRERRVSHPQRAALPSRIKSTLAKVQKTRRPPYQRCDTIRAQEADGKSVCACPFADSAACAAAAGLPNRFDRPAGFVVLSMEKRKM
jgi:hypothetical protein